MFLGVTFQYTGVEPDVMTENDTVPLICPFNDENTDYLQDGCVYTVPLICPLNDENTDYLQDGFVCVYRVRVTEVFAGNFSSVQKLVIPQVGDVITSAGPDTSTSCSLEEGRILQLRAEYLVGVGGPCTPLNDWSLLSSYSDNDLETLRDLAETRDPEKCGSPPLSGLAAVVVFLTAGLIFLI
jgi:hypothetical protein